MDIENSRPKIAIVGAGRTGRGFLARILRDQARIIFIDADKDLIGKLNSRGEYDISYYDSHRRDTITGYEAYATEDAGCGPVLESCACVFVSVGAENTADAGAWLEKFLHPDICVVACENAVCPAELFGRERLGGRACSGAVFCTTTEDSGGCGSLDIIGENYPLLYTDKNVPDFIAGMDGIEAVGDFATLMRRKIYTYNAASAIIAYIGAKKGYELYSGAANDPEIDGLLNAFYGEINKAICAEYGIEHEEQANFALLSKIKFQNPKIIDSISRNAASPARKLSPSERIIEPARLILKHGGGAEALAKTAAAAIRYMGAGGQSEINDVLSNTCGLRKDEKLYELISAHLKTGGN